MRRTLNPNLPPQQKLARLSSYLPAHGVMEIESPYVTTLLFCPIAYQLRDKPYPPSLTILWAREMSIPASRGDEGARC